MRDHPQFTAYVALICVCFFWGTTYLGVRIALDFMGPASLVSIRNLLSGSILLVWAFATGKALPRGRDLWRTAAFGILTIGVGNGTLAVAELWTPTGLASLFVTTSPFWYVGIDALLPKGEPLHRPTILGLLVGFVGVVGLVAPSAMKVIETGEFSSGGGIVLGFLLLQFSGACWSLGSLMQRNQRLSIDPFVIGGIQQIATGLAVSLFVPFESQPIHWQPEAFGALIYLALFGGIAGYGSYMLALSRLPLAIVSIYTYVNPVVAVFLGWLWYREPFGMREAAAMVVIFLGVWLVRRASAQQLRSNRATDDGRQRGGDEHRD